MRVFIAGASGAIGRRLIPMLVQRGHEVVGTTRGDLDKVRALGAEPVIMDGLDPQSVSNAVGKATPDVVVHELTAISGSSDLKHFDRMFAMTNRLRVEGTRNLLAAARAAGATRFVVQGFTGWNNERTGGPVKSETDPLDPEPAAGSEQSMAAFRELESTVEAAKDVKGIVLRYGLFYGPGTSLARGGEQIDLIAKRRFPIVGGGTGVWSFIHIDDAAEATVRAIESDVTGIFNIVDDDPAPVAEVVPVLARALGAKPPWRVPAWLVRPLLGEFGVSMMTKVRGSSNAKARRELGWQPRHSSWRQGLPETLR
jgi:nucleoside-diphosphate-sugar epimerase